MTVRRARWGFLFATLLSASFATAGNGDARVRISAAQVPAGTDAKTLAALNHSLQRYLADAHLVESLRPYTVSPSLVQLRRYVEDDTPKQAKLVCLIDLALNDAQGNVVASVRGSAITRGASPHETIDAATHAAVSRLPGALQALDSTRKSPTQVAAR